MGGKSTHLYRCSLFLSCPAPCHLSLLPRPPCCFLLPWEVAAAPDTRTKNIRPACRNIEWISPSVYRGPVGVDIGLVASDQALVHSGLDIDLPTYEQVLVQDGQERGHHFWIRPMRLQTRQFLLRLKWYNWHGSHFLLKFNLHLVSCTPEKELGEDSPATLPTTDILKSS